MRFFTLDAYHHDLDEIETARLVFDRYTAHLKRMEGVLPDAVLALARLDGVDDGLIISVDHRRTARVLTLTMRCGDLGVGYYDLVITYKGASLLPEHDRTLACIARSQPLEIRGCTVTPSDIAYHEVDLAANGRIEHRLLFNPGCWFAIQCDSLTWRQRARPDRRLPPKLDRYPGGPR